MRWASGRSLRGKLEEGKAGRGPISLSFEKCQGKNPLARDGSRAPGVPDGRLRSGVWSGRPSGPSGGCGSCPPSATSCSALAGLAEPAGVAGVATGSVAASTSRAALSCVTARGEGQVQLPGTGSRPASLGPVVFRHFPSESSVSSEMICPGAAGTWQIQGSNLSLL